jgi:hypothetical protein
MQSEREEVGLVEATLSFSCRVQRNRHNEIESASRQPRILDSLGKPASKDVTKMNLPPVLKIVHDFPDDTATPIGGDRRVEVQDAIVTIRASERLRNRTGKRLRAFRAERRQNFACRFRATRAERLALIDGSGTRGTVRRIE